MSVYLGVAPPRDSFPGEGLVAPPVAAVSVTVAAVAAAGCWGVQQSPGVVSADSHTSVEWWQISEQQLLHVHWVSLSEMYNMHISVSKQTV